MLVIVMDLLRRSILVLTTYRPEHVYDRGPLQIF